MNRVNPQTAGLDCKLLGEFLDGRRDFFPCWKNRRDDYPLRILKAYGKIVQQQTSAG
jgi:hypothetical protein